MADLSQDGLARLAAVVAARPELDEQLAAVLHELRPDFGVFAAVIAGARAMREERDRAALEGNGWRAACSRRDEEVAAAEEKCRALAQELTDAEAALAAARATLESGVVVACEVRAAIGQMLQDRGHIMTQDQVARWNGLLWRLDLIGGKRA